MPDECYIQGREELGCAAELLVNNIKESDGMDWEYEITELEEPDEE